MKILLHPSTSLQINSFLNNPSHALLIEAAQGSGKGMISNYIACHLLNISESKLSNNQFVLRIEPINNVVTIETIRQINKFLQLKTFGDSSIRRVVIIEQADKMPVQAQNALLKVLEEPPTDTVLILTAFSKLSLLPTIRSRAQSLTIKTVLKQDALEHFNKLGHDLAAVERAFYISDGALGLMAALLTNDEEHVLSKAIKQAKTTISSSVFERLSSLEKITKSEYPLSEFLYALQRVFKAVLVQAVESNQYDQQKRAHHALSLINQAESKLSNNPNPKLLLTDLLVNI